MSDTIHLVQVFFHFGQVFHLSSISTKFLTQKHNQGVKSYLHVSGQFRPNQKALFNTRIRHIVGYAQIIFFEILGQKLSILKPEIFKSQISQQIHKVNLIIFLNTKLELIIIISEFPVGKRLTSPIFYKISLLIGLKWQSRHLFFQRQHNHSYIDPFRDKKMYFYVLGGGQTFHLLILMKIFYRL